MTYIWRSIAAVALATGIYAPANAADSTARGDATVVRPLEIVKTRDLEFGQMLSGNTAGQMIVNPNTDVRTANGGVTASGTDGHAARFETVGGPLQFLFVSRGPLPTLTNAAGDTMDVSELRLNGPTFRFLDNFGLLDLRVGGTLEVDADQEPGEYSGDFTITVTYF